MPTKKTAVKKAVSKRVKKPNSRTIKTLSDLNHPSFDSWTEEEKGILIRITQWRKENSIKISDVADGMGMSHEAISHLFAGRYKPNIRFLVYLKQTFGLSYNYLIEGDDSTAPTDVKVKQIIELVLSWENWGQAKLKQKSK